MTPAVTLEVDGCRLPYPRHYDGAIIAVRDGVQLIDTSRYILHLAAHIASIFIDRHCMQSPYLVSPCP